MNEVAQRISLRERIRQWLFDRCFAYCIHSVHPDADPNEFCFLDMVNFIAVDKEEIREIIEEAPDVAWRFEGRLAE